MLVLDVKLELSNKVDLINDVDEAVAASAI